MGNKDYTRGHLIQMKACTGCRLCVEACPAVSASHDGRLSAPFRLQGLNRLLKGRAGLLSRLFRSRPPSGEEISAFSDTVFRCTLCGNCEEVCPVGIQLKELWLSLRHDLVHSRAYPSKIEAIRENLEESHNVFGEDNEERVEWVEDMRNPPDDAYVRDRAPLVYFTGCVASYFPLAQKIPMALCEILEASGVEFTLLGAEEWCCGFPLLGAGLKEMFELFREHNLRAVEAKGASQVLFACPSCFQMWREYYPKTVSIVHASQFLEGLVREGRVPLREVSLTVTYHDPCDLGRGARVFEEPRRVIRSIPGVRLVELPRNREECRCCGGGGNLEMIDKDLSARIAEEKIQEIMGTGAQAVVTSCQQCLRTMMTYVRRNKIPLEVLDITQLIHKALKP